MPCRLIGYIRVSTTKQGASGLGLEAQDAAIRAYQKATGCSLEAVYTEVESGKRSDRPRLAEALAHAKRIKATLVIAKLDRLARNVHFLSGLMEAGVDFVACDNPNANRLTVHILAAVAEDEARRISERTRAALAAYKARGGVLGGYRAQSPGLTQEARLRGAAAAGKAVSAAARDAYADLAPRIHSWKEEGTTLQQIADRLTASGTRTRRGSKWSPTQVKRVIDGYMKLLTR